MADETPKALPRKLTPKQERFCQHFTTYWVATRAAKEAGYSAKSAHAQGYQLLKLPIVKARIAELTAHALKEIGISRERVLTELALIAFLDPSGAYRADGKLLPIPDMPEAVRRAVVKLEVFEEYEGFGENREYIGDTTKVEFAPKKAALDSLGKHLGLLPEKHELSGPGGKPIEVTDPSRLTDAQLDEQINAKLQTIASAAPAKDQPT